MLNMYIFQPKVKKWKRKEEGKEGRRKEKDQEPKDFVFSTLGFQNKPVPVPSALTF